MGHSRSGGNTPSGKSLPAKEKIGQKGMPDFIRKADSRKGDFYERYYDPDSL